MFAHVAGGRDGVDGDDFVDLVRHVRDGLVSVDRGGFADFCRALCVAHCAVVPSLFVGLRAHLSREGQGQAYDPAPPVSGKHSIVARGGGEIQPFSAVDFGRAIADNHRKRRPLPVSGAGETGLKGFEP